MMPFVDAGASPMSSEITEVTFDEFRGGGGGGFPAAVDGGRRGRHGSLVGDGGGGGVGREVAPVV